MHGKTIVDKEDVVINELGDREILTDQPLNARAGLPAERLGEILIKTIFGKEPGIGFVAPQVGAGRASDR